MPSTFSTNLKVELIADGEQTGSWGATTNTNLGTALEEAIVGQATANFATDADLTLTLANSNASQPARALVLVATGTLAAPRNLIVPTINKTYIVRNTTTGGQIITVKTSAGTGVAVPNGTSLMLYADGTNVVKAFDYSNAAGDVTLTGIQTLTNKTVEKLVLNDGYTEEVFAVSDGASVTLDPNNGSIQTWTLGASRTPDQANWASGQSITLLVDDGTAYTITWSTLGVVWKTDNGAAPALNTTGVTVIVLWKVGTTIYGARVGDA